MVKTFIPLECNPSVFNSLAYSLGLSNKYAFYDILSFDSEILSLTRRPSYALVFLYPHSKGCEELFESIFSSPSKSALSQSFPDDDRNHTAEENRGVFKLTQTIRNSCGMTALIHILSNLAPFPEQNDTKAQTDEKKTEGTCGSTRDKSRDNSDENFILPSSLLEMYLDKARLLSTDRARGDLLQTISDVEIVYDAALNHGTSTQPELGVDPAHSFICFVPDQEGRVWVMTAGEGGKGCIGRLESGEDMLSERVLDLGVRRLLNVVMKEGKMGVGCLTLGPNSTP